MRNRENTGDKQRKHRLGNRWGTEKTGETHKTQVGITENTGAKQRKEA